MPCPFQWLVITDGTTNDAGIRNQIDLVSPSGFCLLADGDWMPAITEPKGGGVWRDSQLADGRRPADFKAQNVTESMTLTVSALDQDALIRDTQNLRRLLNKARTYGTTQWQSEPVWIEAQSPGESEMRYAIVWNYSTPNDGNPYEQPFFQLVAKAGMSDFTLILEREPYWRADVPRSSTATEIASYDTYEGRVYGNVDSAQAAEPTSGDEEVFISYKDNVANITHIFTWSNLNGWSLNQVGAAPFDLIDIAGVGAPAVGDYVIFGSAVAPADSGHFNSLVFDIGTVAAGMQIGFGGWEYSTGVAGVWAVLAGVQDNTNLDGVGVGSVFDTLGIKAVYWDADQAGWNPQVENLVNGWWVRVLVTNAPGPFVAPVQQSRDVYTVTWSFVEIAAAEVAGDYAALSSVRIDCQADDSAGTPEDLKNRVVMGLRSVSRGAIFRAFLTLSNKQNIAGATCTSVGVGGYAFDALAASTRSLQCTNPAASAEVGAIGLTAALAAEYSGRFHVYMRANYTTGASGDISFYVQLVTQASAVLWTSPTTSLTSNTMSVWDLGTINIPSYEEGQHAISQLHFRIYVAGNGASDCTFYDMIFIPTDEWALDSVDWMGATSITGLRQRNVVGARSYLIVDGAQFLKKPGNQLRLYSTDTVLLPYQSISPAWPVLQANSRQRLWFLLLEKSGAMTAWESFPTRGGASVNIRRVQRYLSMRGDR